MQEMSELTSARQPDQSGSSNIHKEMTPSEEPLQLPSSMASSSSNSNAATVSTAVHGDYQEELEGQSGERRNGRRVEGTEENGISDSDDEDYQEDEDDGEEEDQDQEERLPRQGLPSFWHALKRLNITEPRSIIHSLNFFRWHVIVGIVVPLITAGIFCACNTNVNFAYIDALFMTTSALTLTGLSTILLGDMSFGQQFILYLLLQFGSIQFVSLLVLYVRRSTFISRFATSSSLSGNSKHSFWQSHHTTLFKMKDEEMKIANGILDDPDATPQLDEEGRHVRRRRRPVQDDAKSKGRRSKMRERVTSPLQRTLTRVRTFGPGTADKAAPVIPSNEDGNGGIQLQRMHSPVSMESHDYASHPLKKRPTQASQADNDNDTEPIRSNGTSTSLPHNPPQDKHLQRMRQRTMGQGGGAGDDGLRRSSTSARATGRSGSGTTTSINRRRGTATSGIGIASSPTKHTHHTSARGGFPNPIHAVFSEGVYQLKKRTHTRSRSTRDFDLYHASHDVSSGGRRGERGLPRSSTGVSSASSPSRRAISKGRTGTQRDEEVGGSSGDARVSTRPDGNGNLKEEGSKDGKLERVPTRQVSLPASGYRFGRNSTVRDLSRDAHQKLAHLEISGMTLLIYIIITWWIGLQLLFVIIWSPYFEAGHFGSVFDQYNPDVSRTWFSVFQVASMLNNCGLSLVDGSLTPFRTCFIMLVPGVFLMLIGNLGYPISLRFTIWLLHSCLRVTSKLRFITSFMLAHPRRIFYYIFPPYETQALFIVVLLLTIIDWVCFFLLDIGYTSPVFSISTGSAVISGLVQSVAVRSAGFYTIPLFQVAPALDMLYLFMMAFCIYPLALAIRATNVYEERSLGIHNDEEDTLKAGIANLRKEKGYTKFHLREQLAYDVWYILLVFWLICIVERNNIGITGADPAGSIDMFAILFEVTSAYANVGFSIGSPTVDTSISGSLRHLSKLILCVTMLRGRTRGLPVLVDRAVLTPRQLERYGDPAEGLGDEEEDATAVR